MILIHFLQALCKVVSGKEESIQVQTLLRAYQNSSYSLVSLLCLKLQLYFLVVWKANQRMKANYLYLRFDELYF